MTRPRVTQVMNLLALAPDIQEAIFKLPRTESGGEAVTERQVRGIAMMVRWEEQREMWGRMRTA